MRPRIMAGRVYVRESIPGISGFKQWDRRELRLVNAATARLYRSEITGEYAPSPGDSFRLEDGRAPEFQPVADATDATAWVLAGNGSAFWKTV